MNDELKNINSDVVKVFCDLMNNLKFDEERINNSQDEDEYEIDYWFLENRLKRTLINLIIKPNQILTVRARKLENGDYFTFGHSKFELYIVEWIKDNLDVWDIEELEYDDKYHQRRFIFKRKG